MMPAEKLVVVVLGRQLLGPLIQLLGRHETFLKGQFFQGGQPALVIS